LLDVTNLECVRGDRPLFRGLSFAVRPGELLHVAGANGSGKTTLLRTLCGLSRPATGEIRWHNTDIRELGDDYHQQLAYVGHLNGIQGELTARENLRVAACLVGATGPADTDAVLAQVGLAAYRDFPAKILSQGQKRRLALARLAVARKPLWILDEPFSALDAHSLGAMTALLSDHLATGGMIIITSHQDLAIEFKAVVSVKLDS
jgi:heme exporter protein A